MKNINVMKEYDIPSSFTCFFDRKFTFDDREELIRLQWERVRHARAMRECTANHLFLFGSSQSCDLWGLCSLWKFTIDNDNSCEFGYIAYVSARAIVEWLKDDSIESVSSVWLVTLMITRLKDLEVFIQREIVVQLVRKIR